MISIVDSITAWASEQAWVAWTSSSVFLWTSEQIRHTHSARSTLFSSFYTSLMGSMFVCPTRTPLLSNLKKSWALAFHFQQLLCLVSYQGQWVRGSGSYCSLSLLCICAVLFVLFYRVPMVNNKCQIGVKLLSTLDNPLTFVLYFNNANTELSAVYIIPYWLPLCTKWQSVWYYIYGSTPRDTQATSINLTYYC